MVFRSYRTLLFLFYIKECWSKVKSLFRRSALNSNEAIDERFDMGFRKVTGRGCEGWIEHAIEYL
jgi:hypothetical protein